MSRERLTITLDTDLLAALDGSIDGSNIRNRSHAIEHFIREGLALSQFHHTILILTEEWDSSTLPKLVEITEAAGITHYYIVQTAVTASIAAAVQTSIQQLAQHTPTITLLPGEFGSAGALTLQKANLTSSFLIIECTATLRLPASLVPAFAFHRQRPEILTLLLDNEIQPSGLSIAKPELLNKTPAGNVSLESGVFPALLKAGKVSAYVYAH